jgi:hypothetical protein
MSVDERIRAVAATFGGHIETRGLTDRPRPIFYSRSIGGLSTNSASRTSPLPESGEDRTCRKSGRKNVRRRVGGAAAGPATGADPIKRSRGSGPRARSKSRKERRARAIQPGIAPRPPPVSTDGIKIRPGARSGSRP